MVKKRESGREPTPTRSRRAGRQDQAVVYFQRDGRRRSFYLGPWGSERAASRYVEFLEAYRAGRDPRDASRPRAAHTIRDVVNARIHELKARFTDPGSAKPRRQFYNLLTHLRRLLDLGDHVPVNSLDLVTFERLRTKMIGDGLSRTYIQREFSRIRETVRYGVGLQIVKRKVLDALEALPPLRVGQRGVREAEPLHPTVITDAHVEAVAEHLPKALATWLRFTLATGCRPSESLLATRDEIDDSNPTSWWLRKKSHKSSWRDHDRNVPLTEKARKIIAPLLQNLGPKDPLFPSRSGRAYASLDSVRNTVHRAAKRAGVGCFGLYALRRGFAGQARVHVGMDATGALLGHQDTRTTKDYVKHMRDRIAEQAARDLERKQE